MIRRMPLAASLAAITRSSGTASKVSRRGEETLLGGDLRPARRYTRQVIVNDDLDSFTRIPQGFGVQAANPESDLVWSAILGPQPMGRRLAGLPSRPS